MNTKLHRFTRYWLPPIVWLAVILAASSDLMSAEHTSRFIGPFLRWIMPEVSPVAVAAFQLYLRKAAHLAGYAILAALMLRALCFGGSCFRTFQIVCVLAVAGMCATADELHQSFVASRTGSLFDVMLDVLGALIGIGLYWCFRPRRAAVRHV